MRGSGQRRSGGGRLDKLGGFNDGVADALQARVAIVIAGEDIDMT